MNRDDQNILLDRLLSGRDAPSVTEREQLWARLEGGLPRRRAFRLLRWGGSFAALAAAAAVLFFAVQEPEFGERGGDRASLEISCLVDEAVAVCVPGAELVLEFAPPESSPFVSAFIQRPDGLIAWIAPTAAGESQAFRAGNRFAVKLDEASGESIAVFVFTPARVDREAVKTALEEGPPPDWQVIERTFRVEGPLP